MVYLLPDKGLVKKLQIFIGVLLFLFSVNTCWSAEYGHIKKRAYGVNPTMPGKEAAVKMKVACHDIMTGKYIDCNFTHKVIGLKEPASDLFNNGGHDHADDRPLGRLQYGGADEDPSSLGINGNTGYFIAFLAHIMPEVSGNIVTESTLTLPRSWQCIWNCFTRNTVKSEDTIYVGIGELEALDGEGYKLKCEKEAQNCTTYEHTDFYNVTNLVNSLFNGIASTYNQKFPAGPLLVITDASLYRGGLYDFKNTWANPHNRHRIGTDIDVRSTNLSEKQKKEFESIVCANNGFPDLEYPGTTNEHYHLYFSPYNADNAGHCE